MAESMRIVLVGQTQSAEVAVIGELLRLAYPTAITPDFDRLLEAIDRTNERTIVPAPPSPSG